MKAQSFTATAEEKYIRQDIERAPLLFAREKLSGSPHDFGVDEIMQHGIYKEMGFTYDLRPYLKHFVYKQAGGSWHEAYALNRANLRHLIYGRITQILEA